MTPGNPILGKFKLIASHKDLTPAVKHEILSYFLYVYLKEIVQLNSLTSGFFKSKDSSWFQ
jgi:hypothetical protein